MTLWWLDCVVVVETEKNSLKKCQTERRPPGLNWLDMEVKWRKSMSPGGYSGQLFAQLLAILVIKSNWTLISSNTSKKLNKIHCILLYALLNKVAFLAFSIPSLKFLCSVLLPWLPFGPPSKEKGGKKGGKERGNLNLMASKS